MRIALARALFCVPDVLALDEPTNHLDIPSVMWLEQYLQKWPRTLLVVSHDRLFMNNLATDIVHFSDKKLIQFRGDYDAFEKARSERLLNQQRAYESAQKQRSHVQQFIDKFRFNAKRASLVQSRIKALERMQAPSAILEDPSFTFTFDDPDPIQGTVVRFDNVSFSYTPPVPLLFKNLDFSVQWQDRIALVGANGQGKTSILHLVAEQIKATKGAVLRNPNCRVAMFSQHHVDQLDMDKSSLEFMIDRYPGHTLQHIRSLLSRYGLAGDLALNPINTLSGGQKSRVVFAMIAMQQPHFILMDEPSNHLDLDTVEVLCHALNQFTGGLMLVSHDERLITSVCNELWVVHGGSVKPWKDSFEAYKKQLSASWTDDQIVLSHNN